MKNKKLPWIGLYFYAVSLIVLIVAYIIALSTFKAYNEAPDRFVIIFPLFAMYIIIAEVVMSFLDKDKPVWFSLIDLAYCFLVLFSFAKLLIPLLTPIGIYFTVNMGDMETYAVVVPRCITGCVLFAVSGALFVIGSFFKIVKIKEAK